MLLGAQNPTEDTIICKSHRRRTIRRPTPTLMDTNKWICKCTVSAWRLGEGFVLESSYAARMFTARLIELCACALSVALKIKVNFHSFDSSVKRAIECDTQQWVNGSIAISLLSVAKVLKTRALWICGCRRWNGNPFVVGLRRREMEISVLRLRNYANLVTIVPQAMNQQELMHETNYEFMWFIMIAKWSHSLPFEAAVHRILNNVTTGKCA